MKTAVTPTWLRVQGDRCSERAGDYVEAGTGAVGTEVSEMYARLARDWFAAASQAYSAAYELDVDE